MKPRSKKAKKDKERSYFLWELAFRKKNGKQKKKTANKRKINSLE